jgi:hypothetical protein
MSRPEIKRFAISVYKDRSGSDKAQVPAGGASVGVYRQGATVNGNVTVTTAGAGVLVTVFNMGGLLNGDALQLNTDSTKTMAIVSTTGYPSDTQIFVKSTNGQSIVLVTGDRLVPTGSRPACYSDSLGINNLGDTLTVSSTNGAAEAYIAAPRFDYIISGSGITSSLVIDNEGGWVVDGLAWRNAKNYTSIQAAIDSLPAQGGTVYVPSGQNWVVTDTIFTPCDRPCHLIGDAGDFYNDAGTRVVFNTANDFIRVRGSFSSIRRMKLIQGTANLAANEETGRGIQIGRRAIVDPHPHPGTDPTKTEVQQNANEGKVTRNVLIEDVVVKSTPGWGIFISGQAGGFLSDGSTLESGTSGITNGPLSIFVTLNRVWIGSPLKYGCFYVGAGNTTVRCYDCIFTGATSNTPRGYVYCQGVQVTFDKCTFEGQCPGSSTAWVRLLNQQNHLIDCWWEEDTGDGGSGHTPDWFVELGRSAPNAMTADHASIIRPHWVREEGSGRPRLLRSISSRGTFIEHPWCVCSAAEAADAWVETNHIDLSGDVGPSHVVGPGVVHGTSFTGAGVGYIQYTGNGFSHGGNLTQGLVAPQISQTDKGIANFGAARQVFVNGAIWMNWDLTGNGTVGCLEYNWGGSNGGVRLINNAPNMTKAERDNRNTWKVGDVVYITNATNPLQICTTDGGAATGDWRYIALTALTGADF